MAYKSRFCGAKDFINIVKSIDCSIMMGRQIMQRKFHAPNDVIVNIDTYFLLLSVYFVLCFSDCMCTNIYFIYHNALSIHIEQTINLRTLFLQTRIDIYIILWNSFQPFYTLLGKEIFRNVC